jgi:invasion protein IalB
MINLPSVFSLRLTVALVVGALAVGWVGRGAVNPASEGASVVGFGDWRMSCPPRSDTAAACSVTQELAQEKGGAPILRFGVTADQASPTIDIVVPFNVLLPKGIGLKVGDGELRTFLFRTCTAVGCIATIKPDNALYRAVLGSGKISILFADVTGKPVMKSLTKTGFARAVSAMNAAEGKRHSWLRRVLL